MKLSLVLVLPVVLGAFVIPACGGSENASPAPAPNTPDAEVQRPVDAGEDTGEKPKLAAPVFPTVKSRGGPVATSGKVQVITFPADPLTQQIQQFSEKIAVSEYWKNAGAEYGVGPLTVLPPIVNAEDAPTTTTEEGIDQWLVQKLSGATPAFGAPDSNKLYAIYYPASTTIEDGGSGLGKSCESYGGYHYETQVGGVKVAYAVMPRCSDIGDLTVTASHEYFEWATDSFPLTAPAYNRFDDDHLAWGLALLAELSDLCTYLDGQDFITPTDIGFLVQRQWSNKLSLSGKHPCGPDKKGPYVQGVPDVQDVGALPDVGDPSYPMVKTPAIYVEPGKSRTVNVQIYSDQDVSNDISLRAMSFLDFQAFGGGGGGGGGRSDFTYSIENTAKVGDVVELTITAPKTSQYGFDVVVIMSTIKQRSMSFWPVAVTIDKDGAKAQAAKNISTALQKRSRIRTMPTREQRARMLTKF